MDEFFRLVFLREKLSVFKVLGLAFACIGVFLILNIGLSIDNGVGVLLLVGSSISWSVASLILRAKLAKKDMFCIAAWQMTFGSIGLVVLAWYVDGGIVFDAVFDSVISLIYVSIGASVVAFTLWFYIVSRVALIRSSMASLAVPVIVLGIQEVRSGQPLDFIFVFASVFIILGLVMVIIGDRGPRAL